MPLYNKLMYLEIRRSKKLFYHVVVKGRNGEVVFTSENYYSYSNARRAARRAANAFNISIRE